jgi:CHAT domain-containing protein
MVSVTFTYAGTDTYNSSFNILIGNKCNNAIYNQYPILQDHEVNNAIIKIVKRLVGIVGKNTIEPVVIVLNDPTPNIFSFPNHICITTGLLDVIDNSDQLAYLLAREIAYLSTQTHIHFCESEQAKILHHQDTLYTIYTVMSIAGAIGGVSLHLATMMPSNFTSAGPSIGTQVVGSFGPQLVAGGAPVLGVAAMGMYYKTIATDDDNQVMKIETSFDNEISGLKRQAALAKQKGKTEASNKLNADLQALNLQHDQYIQRLRQENPRYAALWHPEPVMPEQTPAAPGEHLVRYKVTDWALLVWLVKDGKLVHTETVPITREVLRQKVQSYLGAFQHVAAKAQLAKYDIKQSNELYTLLFKPISGKIAERSHVIIVPDDVLEVLPFESLIAEMPANSQMEQGKFGPFPVGVGYLADHYQVSYYYSATSMRIARQLRKSNSPSQSLFMMADPSGSPGGRALAQSKSGEAVMSMAKKEGWTSFEEQFEPLPRARELSEKLKQLYPDGRFLVGESATKDNLSGIEKNRYVVFATHGILAREIPYIEEPALLLYPERGADDGIRPKGFLTMSEVMKLNLTCDNASLTACSTGLGRSSSGEGVMSMGWAFQYAGAKSVLVSLWNVDEKSSVLLAVKYFENLKAGKDRMTALSDARTAIRRMGYEHPFYWAPFILIGETN